jgi:hypothetical protein
MEVDFFARRLDFAGGEADSKVMVVRLDDFFK